mmetsp:Transcript_51004/g.128734  ORF Transcript_51004/g.128734 Transcript_51004/m.128734 type:complete len:232 (+) Transcript_51004:2630-3325(+)
MPIRVVVPLLRALQPVAVVGVVVPPGVLPRGRRAAVVVDLLVRCVEPIVAFPGLASRVIFERLMLAEREVRGVLLGRRLLLAARGVLVAALGAIAEAAVVGLSHVLQDHLAPQVGMPNAAAVLRIPLDVEFRTLVVGHDSLHGPGLILVVVPIAVLADRIALVANLIARRSIVLRVEEAVVVLHVVALLGELVVGSSWIVQVDVRAATGDPRESTQDGQHPYKSSGPAAGL